MVSEANRSIIKPSINCRPLRAIRFKKLSIKNNYPKIITLQKDWCKYIMWIDRAATATIVPLAARREIQTVTIATTNEIVNIHRTTHVKCRILDEMSHLDIKHRNQRDTRSNLFFDWNKLLPLSPKIKSC